MRGGSHASYAEDWVDRWKAISSQDHCQRSSPLRISDTLQAGFEPVQNLSSGSVEWSCAVVITTTPRGQEQFSPSCLFDQPYFST